MKFTDDYDAKIRIWAAEQRVIPLPPGPKIPKFQKQSFSSYEEMNRWKDEILDRIAAEGTATRD